jgi:hypothetical protein
VDDEVTGVNLTPLVSDDEDFDDTEDDDGSDVEVLGDNLGNEEENEVINVDGPEGEEDGDDDFSAGEMLSDAEDDEDKEDEPVVGLRRSTRDRIIRNPLTFDFSNRAYKLQDSVLHISPTVIQETKEDLKISSPITSAGVLDSKGEKMAIISPRTAGINPRALARLGLPPTQNDEEVEDHVVMHVLGVILAEQ